MARRAKGILIVAVCASLALPALTQAATITPNTATDELAAGGNCSLREAVQSINAGMNLDGCVATVTPNGYGVNDLIRLNPALGTFALTIPGSSEDSNATGDLDIHTSLNIDSTSGNPSITQAGLTDRILDIHPGVTVGLTGITVKDGQAATFTPPGNQGGNILFRGGNNQILQLFNVDVLNGLADNLGGRGGGISSTNGGQVLIQGTSLIQDNVAGGTGAGFGGGIDMSGTGGSLTVDNSTISSNDANFNGPGTTQGAGGGVFFAADGTTAITLTNATFDQNQAAGGTGRGIGTGGGIDVDTGGGVNTLTATGGSITSNTAGGGTGWTTQNVNQSAGFGGGMNYEAAVGSLASLNDVDVVGNRAGGNGEHGNGSGGGIRTAADLTIDNSQVSANKAASDATVTPAGPDLFGSGGGIQTTYAADADLTITDSSINSNAAGDNLGFGAGIDMESAGNLSLTDSTISGNAAGSSTAGGGAQGGGINRFAQNGTPTDTITRTTISANTTTGAGGQPEGTPEGAGISAVMQGSLTIDSSAIVNNTATGVNGNPNGGGLYLDSTTSGPAATYNLINSTISGNTATSAANQGGNGGGIAVAGTTTDNPPSVTLTHMTVAGNTAGTDTFAPIDSGLGGNLYLGVESGLNLFDLRATIIAGGTAGAAGTGNCGVAVAGAIQSLGENVEQTTPTQCELDGLGDQVGVNPMLDLLNPSNGGDPNNGIPAATRPLIAGSPAIDSVPAGGCPAKDQRGVTRPQGAACDAGAFELDQRLVTVSRAGTGTGTVTGPGISCPGDCSEFRPLGSQVILSATPGSTSTFSGWSGACTGAGSCVVDIDGNKAVTATFTANPVAPAKKCKKKKKKHSAAAAKKKCKRKKK